MKWNRWIIAVMVMVMLFTMTACKKKKPTEDPTGTSAAVEDTLEQGQPGKDVTGAGDESIPADGTESTAADGSENTGETSGAGQKNPTGTSGNKGQTGNSGNNTGNNTGNSTGGNQSSSGSGNQSPEEEDTLKLPWENGGKQPSEYTWEEYIALSVELKDAFLLSFSDVRDYERWRDEALEDYNSVDEDDYPDEQPEESTEESTESLPWENGGKQPDQYTWAEYQALTPGQQMAFQRWFADIDAFEVWMREAQGNEEAETEYLPWENGGKKPSDYTWAEYQALTPGQQMAFQKWFPTMDAFDAWMQQAQGNNDSGEEYLPWENGGKKPDQYTWAEFEALTPDQQMAFQNWFASVDEFTAWMQQAQGNGDSDEEYLPWEHGGKQPDQYTWAEFIALTPGQQMAFQNWFSSIDAFDAWMQQAQGDSSAEETMPWDEPGAKQPDQYTWAEFEALTPGQQMAFQNWFDSIDAFDAWMQQAQQDALELPWENGGKTPDQYTWAEFQALTPAQQMAFQNWFATWEEFDKWLQANQP